MFFILEMKEGLESSTQEKLINKLKSNFSDQNPKQILEARWRSLCRIWCFTTSGNPYHTLVNQDL